MHSALLTILQSNLSHQAKALAALFYAHAPDLPALVEIPVTTVTTALGLGEAKLRSYRSELADCGVLRSSLLDGMLAADLLAGVTPERIQQGLEQRAERQRARAARRAESAPLRRAAPLQRAADESAPLRRAQDAEKRAATARCAPAEGGEIPLAQREESAPDTPHTPPQGIKLINQQQVNPPAAPERGAGETTGAGTRSARLLRAVGVHPGLADELAGVKTFEAIARHVAAWQLARQHSQLTAGALVERIRNWDLPRALEWPDMQVGVLAEHVTEQDLRAWRFHKPHNPLAAYDAPAGYDGIIRH